MSFDVTSFCSKYFQEIDLIRSKASLIFFVGMMGSGKTTIGRIFSEILQYNFIEMDSIIESKFELSVMQIFKKYGVERFRQEEKLLLNSLLYVKHSIVSCGGGVFTNDVNIEQINNHGISVFLNTDVQIIKSRLLNDRKRPLLKNYSIDDILSERMPFYQKAKINIDISDNNINNILYLIITNLYNYLSKE